MHTIKVAVTILVLLGLIITSGIYEVNSLKSSSNKFENRISNIEDNTQIGNWLKTESELLKIHSEWKDTSKLWTILIDHIEIDNIETSLEKFAKYIQERDKTMTLVEAATLKQYIKHIADKESFNIKNIL